MEVRTDAADAGRSVPGDPALDEAVGRLDRLADDELAGHVEAFDQLSRYLADRLDRPSTGAHRRP